jgi:hypothetical protein
MGPTRRSPFPQDAREVRDVHGHQDASFPSGHGEYGLVIQAFQLGFCIERAHVMIQVAKRPADLRSREMGIE